MPVFDIIGDIHGHLSPLQSLLSDLGYVKTRSGWRQDGHHVVFLGDFIDRGPHQVETVMTVREMVENGHASAVMGNHEWNALCWATPDDERPGRFLRAHSDANRHQHQVFLDAVGEGSSVHDEILSWFRTLPLWRDYGSFRAVHACWHPEAMNILSAFLDVQNRLTSSTLQSCGKRGNPGYGALEIVLKGLEIDLPDNLSFQDKSGIRRSRARVRWWDETARDVASAAIVDAETARTLPNTPLQSESMFKYDRGKPVFFGHYWMPGKPRLLHPIATCLDFSIAKSGYLCAYRHDGEAELVSERISYVGSADLEPIAAAAFTA